MEERRGRGGRKEVEKWEKSERRGGKKTGNGEWERGEGEREGEKGEEVREGDGRRRSRSRSRRRGEVERGEKIEKGEKDEKSGRKIWREEKRLYLCDIKMILI